MPSREVGCAAAVDLAKRAEQRAVLEAHPARMRERLDRLETVLVRLLERGELPPAVHVEAILARVILRDVRGELLAVLDTAVRLTIAHLDLITALEEAPTHGD